MKSLLKLLTGHSTVQHTHYAPAYNVADEARMRLCRPGALTIAAREGIPLRRADEIAKAGVAAYAVRASPFEAMRAKAAEIKAEGK